MAADLIIRAVDRATAALSGISQRIQRLFAPLRRLRAAFRRLADAGGLDRLSAGFGRVGKSLGRVGAEAKKLFGGIAKYAGVAALAVGTFVVKQSEAGDELGKNASRVGLSVDAYAQLSAAAEDAGIEQDQFTTALDKFNASLGEAKLGKGKLTAFLQGVSPSLLKSLKGTKDTESALNLVFKAIVKIQGASRKAAFSKKIFGDVDVTQLLADGLPALVATRKEYERLFGSQQRFVDGASALDNGLDNLKRVAGGVARGVATQLFPAFAKIADLFSAWLIKNKDQIIAWAKVAGEKLVKFVEDLPGNLTKLGAKFDEIKAKLAPLAEKVGGFGKLLAILAGLIVGGPLLAAIASLAVSFVALGIAIASTPIGWILIGIAAIAAGAALLVKNWEPVKEFFTNLWLAVREQFEGFIEFLDGVFNLDLKRIWEGIKRMLGGTLGAGLSLFQAPAKLIKAFSDVPERTVSSEVGVGTVLARPMIGAGAARPRAPINYVETRTNNAAITVDFKNAPRGTKFSLPRSNDVDIGLNVGYAPELGG